MIIRIYDESKGKKNSCFEQSVCVAVSAESIERELIL